MPAPKLPLRRFLPCKDLLLLNPLRPSLKRTFNAELRRVITLLPELSGKPITVGFLPQLSVSARKLLSRESRGKAVYAASFIRERRIVLDLALLQSPSLLRAILLHELFHFVWARLGNPLRASFSGILAQERDARARGDLGESSSIAKVSDQEPVIPGTRQWRHYVCESFCDTAAYLLCGANAGEERSRLNRRWLKARTDWFIHASANGWKF